MKWMCVSTAPAVTILPSPAMISVVCADDDVDTRLDVRVAGLADRGDASVPDADVGLDDAPVIDDQRVGDDRIHCAFRTRGLRLPHAVADHLAAAELHFLAVGGEVAFHLDDELGVREAHAIARRWSEHVRVRAAREPMSHGCSPRGAQSSGPMTCPIEPEHATHPAQRHERDFARLSGLEADGRPRRNVQPVAAGLAAVEGERRIGFGEVEVRADLHRAVAAVGDRQRDGLRPGVELDVACRRENLSGNHRAASSDQRIG